jgi:hypothetical protein
MVKGGEKMMKISCSRRQTFQTTVLMVQLSTAKQQQTLLQLFAAGQQQTLLQPLAAGQHSCTPTLLHSAAG